MEPEDYRRISYEAWEAMAPVRERWRAQLEEALTPVREWPISELAPRPGDTVLELAAGPGDTGFAAAALVGERGRLISTDFSPDMVEVTRRRGGELGLQNVDYRVMDAERIEREALRSQLEEEFRPFAVDGGYELPGVALSAVGS